MGRQKTATSITHEKCIACRMVKEISEFHLQKAGGRERHSKCKKCATEYSSHRYRNNPEFKAGMLISSTASNVRKRYGISYGDYLEKLLKQDFYCGLCGKVDFHLELDHCHATGRNRDFICGGCNKLLGWAHDDPEILAKAIRYLEKHQEESGDDAAD